MYPRRTLLINTELDSAAALMTLLQNWHPEGKKVKHPDKEEAQGRHVQSHGSDGELLLSKQMGVIAPERGRAELIKATARW